MVNELAQNGVGEAVCKEYLPEAPRGWSLIAGREQGEDCRQRSRAKSNSLRPPSEGDECKDGRGVRAVDRAGAACAGRTPEMSTTGLCNMSTLVFE